MCRQSLGGSDVGSPSLGGGGGGGGEYHSSQGDSHGLRAWTSTLLCTKLSLWKPLQLTQQQLDGPHTEYIIIGKEEEKERWAETHKVLMDRGKEGPLW